MSHAPQNLFLESESAVSRPHTNIPVAVAEGVPPICPPSQLSRIPSLSSLSASSSRSYPEASCCSATSTDSAFDTHPPPCGVVTLAAVGESVEVAVHANGHLGNGKGPSVDATDVVLEDVEAIAAAAS